MLKNILIYVNLTVCLLLQGCTHQPMSQPAGRWDHMMLGYGSSFMWLVIIIITGIVVYLISKRKKNLRKWDESTPESLAEMVNRRYAKGEISKEELERLKQDIEKKENENEK